MSRFDPHFKLKDFMEVVDSKFPVRKSRITGHWGRGDNIEGFEYTPAGSPIGAHGVTVDYHLKVWAEEGNYSGGDKEVTGTKEDCIALFKSWFGE